MSGTAKAENVQNIPITDIHPFSDHPFKVLDDELMQSTVESVSKFGVLNPVIVRPDENGGYIGFRIVLDKDIKLPDPVEGGDIPLREALNVRQTVRDFLTEEVSLEQISSLLWAANGINRPESGKRTAPSARNVQETDIYLFSKKGIFFYDPEKHMLRMVREGDYREAISDQKHFTQAPIALVLVANYDKMKGFDKESLNFYAPIDCGYISQNIYLYCTENSAL